MQFPFIKNKLLVASRQLLLVAIVVFANITVTTVVNPVSAYAACGAGDKNTNNCGTVDRLKDYCESLKMPSKAEDACKDNAADARNVATSHCTNKEQGQDIGGNAKATCVYNKAKGYLKDASTPKPKGSNADDDFNKNLDKVLKKAGGDRDKASDDSTTSSNKDCNTSNGTTCLSCANGKCLDPAADPDADCDKDSCDLIRKYVNPTINLLSISFGLIAVISLIFGGIQYTASGGDPQKVTEAKRRISNTLIAVVAYLFLYGFLQFLVPGGIFNN